MFLPRKGFTRWLPPGELSRPALDHLRPGAAKGEGYDCIRSATGESIEGNARRDGPRQTWEFMRLSGTAAAGCRS